MKPPKKNVVKRSIALNNYKQFFDKHTKRIRLFSKISFFSLLIIISYIAFLPNYDELPEFASLSDIFNHFIAFFVLSILLDQAYAPRCRHAFLMLLMYGLFIEIVQHFLPNRMFDLLDLVVDMIGVFVYFLSVNIIRYRLNEADNTYI